jgi:hypothetical protein
MSGAKTDKAKRTGKKAKPSADPPKPAGPVLIITRASPDEPRDMLLARTILRPSVAGGLALYKIERRELGDQSDLTVDSLTKELAHQCKLVMDGDLSRPEAMLTAQAHTLDALFSDLIRLAYQNLNHFDAAERLFRLAFRAQGHARATVETLSALKNPPMVFAKQANVTTGPQQVNNGNLQNSTRVGARAENLENQQNKLLEVTHGERLDTLSAGIAGAADQELAALDALDRSKVA